MIDVLMSRRGQVNHGQRGVMIIKIDFTKRSSPRFYAQDTCRSAENAVVPEERRSQQHRLHPQHRASVLRRLIVPPLLLEGEDAEAYDELLARVCAAVRPADIIDEIFTAEHCVLGV